ncbi:hypothetical protein IW261DRAFT_1424055 [Armillaria novae-zelandiae]|uniref:Uncharacterized protein n=1 Tax=Armillaria novae-zelandiae TaxID=153914 RepID=A0AA39NVV2_9AGAR|nr:hypothetical protein IW261DRAFT_1424055 [Armillaria novae-zelandiae]
MSNRTTAADHANRAPARMRSQPVIEVDAPSTTPILDAIKLRTITSRSQGGTTTSTAQRGKANTETKKHAAKLTQVSMSSEEVNNSQETGLSKHDGNDVLNGTSGPQRTLEEKRGTEANAETEEMIPNESQQGDTNMRPGNNDTTAPKSPVTPQSLPHFKKRKSEIEEDMEPYYPRGNTFFPLLQDDVPATKKPRNGLPEVPMEEFEESDGDDTLSTRQMSQTPSQNEEAEEQDDDMAGDDDAVQKVPTARILKVHAPKAVAKPVADYEHAIPMDPFARRLPGHEGNNQETTQVFRLPHSLQPQAPPSMYAPAVTPEVGMYSSKATRGQQPSELAQMVAPMAFATRTAQTARDGYSIIVYREQAGTYGPHTIPPQHIFHNYEWTQVTNLFSSQEEGNILIIVWGMEYKNLTYSTEAKIEATLKEFFENDKLNIQIAPPTPPPTYHLKGPIPPSHQPFIHDHTRTPFTFYVWGLEPEEKAWILKEIFLPMNHDSYLILDARDFVTNFVFTIDGINATPDELGQSTVEKLIKDKLYPSQKVWTFLTNHHDAIDTAIPADEIPVLVILSLKARSLWIEGRRGEPGRLAWNIWIAHPTKIPIYHLDWLAALRSVFPIMNGESHPTAQCLLKEQLGSTLKRPRDENALRGKPKPRGG